MKLKLTALLFFISFFAQAKFIEASILFNDGHTEKGFVKSFLEMHFVDFDLFKSTEQELNLDQMNLKFKASEKGEIRTINIDEVSLLTLTYKPGDTEQYRPLYLMEIGKDGELKKRKMKMWFPLFKDGKINVYGYKYEEKGSIDGRAGFTDVNFLYYFQNPKDDFAVNPYQNLTSLNMKKNNRIMEGFYNLMFKDCPDYASKVVAKMSTPLSKEEKQLQKDADREAAKKLYRVGRKTTVAEYYDITQKDLDGKIAAFEKECP